MEGEEGGEDGMYLAGQFPREASQILSYYGAVASAYVVGDTTIVAT